MKSKLSAFPSPPAGSWKKIIVSLIRENRGMLVAGVVLGILILAMGWFILWPSYLSPSTKFYASGLGYPAMMRKMGKPLPVVLANSGEKEFVRHIMGEGIVASEPILVPVVPMSIVTKVYVEDGDHVEAGQLLAELDHEMADIKLASAKLAVSTAEAELARVKAGSAYVLAQERPPMERININAEIERERLAREKVDRYRSAYEKGVVSRVALVDAEREFTIADQALKEARIRVRMAEEGVTKSVLIAQNAVRDAKEALAHRELELEKYKVYAPIGGLVERVLIKEGEYNADAGKPGFVIVSGLWFEAYFDQSDFSLVQPGLEGEVRLEAYPGRPAKARVESLVPVVSFNEGGPEISRPLRPRGSGAPEWAATFKSQMHFIEPSEDMPVAMGMTGFGRLTVKRRGTAVPRAALLSISAGAGVVYQVDDEGGWDAREVKVGIVDETTVEILEGLDPDEKVIVEGHWILRETDKVEVTDEREVEY